MRYFLLSSKNINWSKLYWTFKGLHLQLYSLSYCVECSPVLSCSKYSFKRFLLEHLNSIIVTFIEKFILEQKKWDKQNWKNQSNDLFSLWVMIDWTFFHAVLVHTLRIQTKYSSPTCDKLLFLKWRPVHCLTCWTQLFLIVILNWQANHHASNTLSGAKRGRIRSQLRAPRW